jgi:kynurenine formamidase
MCEGCHERGYGWKGWIDLPVRSETGSGPWIDLSYPVGPETPCASIFPKPSFHRIKQQPADPFNVTELSMVVHAGTHLDSPRHYFLDGPAFEEIPLDRLYGPGVVWRIPCVPDQVIQVPDLERARPQLLPGDILALDTGWSAHVGTGLYDRHPSLSLEAAEWLLGRKIKILACDFATPDLVYHLRQDGFDWPVHNLLLSRGILVCEHLTGHMSLAGHRAEFIFAALNIKTSDGAPARILARQIDERAVG